MYDQLEDVIRQDINWRREWVEVEQEEPSHDLRKYRREFTGKMTKRRWEIIDSYCRRNSFRDHCGCEWDCCGCLCGQSMSFSYKYNQVRIGLTQSFNY